MRVQMSLSALSQIILIKEKEDYLQKEGASITYGYITGGAIKNIFKHDINQIDWLHVKTCKLEVENAIIEDKEFSTILNLENSVLEKITELQVFFKTYFGAKRIHRAFAVKLALKANYMEKNSINIFKEDYA
ncbi:hypothetical protein JOD82_002100 [Paenibacillus sp. 1182]|uniref:hypothetical protein n=1 Tax=Paenibacillus sp. 1182 TaxID=2806565 RepID=UPI001B47F989|nr:hypothetical protein [Paenibacillus sp. 1182]MBP1309080.1 hypothetical protein [Paenibacillus sp. 1182]